MTPEQKEENYRLAEQLLSEQDFRKAFISGLLVAVAVIALWAVIAASEGIVMGYMAIGLGGAVGYTIQLTGKGIQPRYVFLAMALALAGCVVGNILAAVFIESIDHQMPASEIFGLLTVGAIANFIAVDLGLIDLLFWIAAISVAAYIAKRRLTRQEQLAIFTLTHSPRTTGTSSGTR